MKSRIALTALIALFSLPLFAEGGTPALDLSFLGAYYPPNLSGYGATDWAPVDFSTAGGGTGEREVGSTWGRAECKAVLAATETWGVLRSDNPLFAGNNLALKGSFGLSPMSTSVSADCLLTPIAFLVFDAGASIGTGWLLGSFDSLGINPVGSQEPDFSPFNGYVTRVWGSATFQFDLAAVWPGPWHHVVCQAIGRFEYSRYSEASDGEAWYWEANFGLDYNGTKFYGTYVLGYQLPCRVSLVGIQAESIEWVGDVRDYSPMSSGWGSDYRVWRIGPLAKLELGPRDSLFVSAQLRRDIDATESTTLNRDFRLRDYDGSLWSFNRVALAYTHRFR